MVKNKIVICLTTEQCNPHLISLYWYNNMIYTKPWLQVGPTYPGTQTWQWPVLTSHLLSWQFIGHGMLQFDPFLQPYQTFESQSDNRDYN